MAEHIDVDEMRLTLQRVAAYRIVCDHVRKRANSTIGSGIFFLFITALLFFAAGPTPVFFVYLGIALGEILVGLWMKLRPSAEGVLADALLQFAFVAALVYRQYQWMQGPGGGQPQIFSVLIGLWVLYDAFRRFQSYLALRRMFVGRPSSAQLRYVDDLVKEVLDGDPDTDPDALDLPTRPRLAMKLIDELALVVELGSGVLTVATRGEVRIDRREAADPDEPPTGYLSIGDEQLSPFPLDPATWRNYAAWKTAGGNPPPPVTVHRAGGEA